jgi:hypoxanthine-DNA glycosylase
VVTRAARPAAPPRRRGLPPVIGADARVLILGSFPSEASLAARQYYAHPRNHFWPILGAVLDEPLAELPYIDRLARVRACGVAIWDTIVACERAGSLDALIRNAEQGEIDRVRRVARELKAVCFNGNTAGRARAAWAAAGYATLVLPSTSPAYTRPLAEKLAAWLKLREYLEER